MRLFALWLLVPSLAFADALAPNQRTLDYSFEIVNIADFDNYYFIIYPTTNSGYGYAIENGADLTNVMMNRRGIVSRLYAMPKDVLSEHDPTAERHEHAVNGVATYVIRTPDSAPRTLVAEADIAPLGTVPLADPRISVTRRFRIAQLDDSTFDLQWIDEITQNRDGTSSRLASNGTREELPAPEGWEAPPEGGELAATLFAEVEREIEAELEEEAEETGRSLAQGMMNTPVQTDSGCGGCASQQAPSGAFVLLLLFVATRRRFDAA